MQFTEGHRITINSKMNNARVRSMPCGSPKNNNSLATLKVNGLDEDKNGCSRWSTCGSRSTMATSSEMGLNNKANMEDEMSMSMGARPG